jgi:hypothetical protein
MDKGESQQGLHMIITIPHGITKNAYPLPLISELTSFGPILVAAAFNMLPCTFKTLIVPKYNS